MSQCLIFHQQNPNMQPPPPVRSSNLWQQRSLAPTHPWQPRPSAPWRPQAHVATSATFTNPNWLLDSRASHHVTTDLENLSLHKLYDGTDDIVIDDGTGLSITHTGSTTLSTPTHIFSLPNVLYVPSMERN